MKDIKIYETTAALRHGNKAILIKVKETSTYNHYMVIDRIGNSEEFNYDTGDIITDLDEYYINEITFDYKIEDSPLYNNLTKFLLNGKI